MISNPTTFISEDPNDLETAFRAFENKFNRRTWPLPIAPYTCPNDVPVPMRHTIRTCYGNGFTVQDLSKIYELPEQWVQLFVLPDDPNITAL